MVKSEFAHEAAIRVLLGFCARVGGVVDIGIEPVAAHSTLHYLRVYFRVARGAAKSDRCLKGVGYVASCVACHEDAVTADYMPVVPRVRREGEVHRAQWVGKLVDEKVVAEAAKDCSKLGWKGAAEALAALEGVDGFPPFGYLDGGDHLEGEGLLGEVPEGRRAC